MTTNKKKSVLSVYHLSFTTKYRRILFKKKKNDNNNNNNNNSKETALPHIRVIHIIKSSR